MAPDAALVEDGLMTAKEAARFLGIGQTLLYGLMERGELPYCKIGGTARRIPRRAVVDYAAKHLRGGWAATA